MLNEAQSEVLEKMKCGSVIGELSDKINGRFELFTKKSDTYVRKSINDTGNFEVKRLNKNTVFALLELGIIKQDSFVETVMSPFSRDCWYVYNPEKRGEKC